MSYLILANVFVPWFKCRPSATHCEAGLPLPLSQGALGHEDLYGQIIKNRWPVTACSSKVSHKKSDPEEDRLETSKFSKICNYFINNLIPVQTILASAGSAVIIMAALSLPFLTSIHERNIAPPTKTVFLLWRRQLDIGPFFGKSLGWQVLLSRFFKTLHIVLVGRLFL